MVEKIRTDNIDVIANACKKISELENKLGEAKELLKELNEGLDKLYLCGGLSDRQITLIEKFQDKAEVFLNSEVMK